MPPVILLAFANDRAGSFLRSIAEEQASLQRALKPLTDRGLIQVEVLADATAEDIFAAFRSFGKRIRLFHYGGHAHDLQVMLSGSKRPLNMQGFAQFLAQQGGLELVFMNGCATAAQQAPLAAAGIPHLILTETAIHDGAAQQFARQFYQSLAAGRGVATSFQEAEGATTAQLGSERRSLVWEQEEDAPATDTGLPWRLHQQGGREFVLPTRAPFPWRKVLLASVFLLILTAGGYGLWRFALPFDMRIPIQYPPEASEAHFRYAHELQLLLPEGTLAVSLDKQALAEVERVSGALDPVALRLQSPLWTLADSQLTLQRSPQALRLVWKASLRQIQGRVVDQDTQSPLAEAQVTLGNASAATQADGRFTLMVPPERIAQLSHRIRLQHPDYALRTWTLNLADGQATYEIPLMRK